MRRLLAALALTVGAAGAAQADDWSALDKGLALATNAAIVADWLQTRQIARQPDRYWECSPLLRAHAGDHPSVGAVNVHFATYALAVNGAALYLPRYRTAIYGGILAAELILVRGNVGIGLRFTY